MGRSHNAETYPFVLHAEEDPSQEGLGVSWERPAEWETINGWDPQGEGPLTGGTEFKKEGHLVEAYYKSLAAGCYYFYVSESREGLTAFKRDHSLPGPILKNDTVVCYG